MRGLRLLSRAVAPLLLLSLSAPAFAATVQKTFTFSPDDFALRPDARGGVRVEAWGGVPWGEVGGPELPAYSALVDLPLSHQAIGATAVASGWVTLGTGQRVAPRQPDRRSDVEGAAEWVDADPALYASADWSEPQLVELALSGKLRDRDLAALRIYPVQYRPSTGELRVATRLDVTVETEFVATHNGPVRRVPEWEAEFHEDVDRVLAKGPAVWRQGLDPAAGRAPLAMQGSPYTDRIQAQPMVPTALPSIEGSPVRYLIVTTAALAPQFDSLAAWKTRKGIPAVVRTLEFINANYPFGIDQAERIRMFIRDAAQQWGTQYVLLGGDVNRVPFRYGRTTFFSGQNIATDLYFSDLDGNWNADGDSLFGEGFIDSTVAPGDKLNLLPDVYVGRVPVENPAELSTWLWKHNKYTRNMEPGYATRALFCAEVMFPQDWMPGLSVALDGATLAESAINRLPGMMTPTRIYENYVPYDSLGAKQLTAAGSIDSMNTGFNLIHHSGHGYRNSMSMGDAPITNPDVTGLTNGDRVAGMVYSINCTSAAIDFESIGEEFLLAPNGGAVNNVGSTHFDFPTTGHSYQNTFFNEMRDSLVREIGAAQALQKVPFVGFATFDNVHRWTQMTLILLGDPECQFVAKEPATLSVLHAGTFSLGDTVATVHVEAGGLPVEGALVCLYKPGDDYRVVKTNASGDATTPFRVASGGNIQITVTGIDVRPYLNDIPVTAAAGVALAIDGTPAIVDAGGATNGNGNATLDAGETVEFTVPVRNVGGVASGAASGTLLSLDGWASVGVAAGSYGVINSSATAAGTAYRITVHADSVIDGDEARFRLLMDDGAGKVWSEDFELTVRAPKLRNAAKVLADVGGGNGDQFPDIGETVDVTFTLLNLTEGSARGVTGTLVSADAGVTVVNGAATFGDIAGDGTAAGTAFRIQNTGTATPRVVLQATDAYGVGFSRLIDFSKPVTPTSIKGIGAASTISLVWTKSSAADLEGYNVYRSANSGGPYSKINVMPTGRSAYYLDAGLAPLTRYYYYVTAVDSSMNESANSVTVSASTNPPLVEGFPIPMGRTTPSSVVVSDYDQDGDLETAVGSDFLYCWSQQSAYLDADGSERTNGDYNDEGLYYASSPAFSDLDLDGQIELIALAWETKQLFILNPDGTHKGVSPVTIADNVWSSPACGDIDGDGTKEIVFNSNGVRVYVFNHDGTEFTDGDGNPATVGVFKTVGGSFNFGSPALADLDNDGRLDVIVPSSDGKVYAWRYDGVAIPGFPYATGAAILSDVTVGDIDDDGMLELCFTSTNNSLYVVHQNGTNQAGFPKAGMATAGNSRSPTPALADLNNDGVHEIVVAGTDGKLRIVTTTGTFYPGWSAVPYSSFTSSASESSPVVADLDGDGSLEILIGSEDGQLYCFDSSGQPFAGFPIRLDGEVRGTPLVVDYDGNGTSEILVAGWDKNLYVWTYPGTRIPNPDREWIMFGHDSERTNRLGNPVVVAVEGDRRIADYGSEPTDGGGVRVTWRLPLAVVEEGGVWRAFRASGSAEGSAGAVQTVPAGFVAVGPEQLVPDAEGWLHFEEFGLMPGQSYVYYLARVETAPDLEPLAFGPYGLVAPAGAPERVYLAGSAYPNPGLGPQTISYGVPSNLAAGARVRLDLYDVRGARVRTLVHGAAEPGRYVVAWDGRNESGAAVPGGVYLYRLTVGDETQNGRLVRLQP